MDHDNSSLRLHVATAADDSLQLTGDEGLTPEGRYVAGALSAHLGTSLAEWVSMFREHASERPDEADAILAAFAEFLERTPEATP
jgi:hypothetical protein